MLQLEVKPGYLVYFYKCIYSVDFFLRALLPTLPNRFCVDLGAADGQHGSNTFLLLLNGWQGLAIEKDPHSFGCMKQIYQELGLDAQLLNESISPENISLLLATQAVPAEFAFLSLDIDSWDYWVLKNLLQHYRPVLICTEINETIPPPLRFTQAADAAPDAQAHFFGYSLALLYDLAQENNYDLLRLDFNNAFLVSREYNHFWPALSAEAAYLSYRQNPRPEYNADLDELLALPPDLAQTFIHRHFGRFQGQYLLSGP
jgi:hypothetical protein